MSGLTLPFRDAFDRILATQGPPAVFTADAGGELRLDPFRTRDAWSRLPPDAPQPPPLEACHCLFRDGATGFVQYVLVTSPALAQAHPRAQIRRYPDQETALQALQALGRPPLAPDPW